MDAFGQECDFDAMKTGSRLYVGNLAWKVTAKELTELFRETKGFEGCQLQIHQDSGRSKGWALARYDSLDNAEAAMKALNGDVLMNRPLFLKFDKESKSKAYDKYIAVYTGNFPWDYSKILISELLEPFTPVYIDVATNMAGKFRGYAIVYFLSIEAAEKAMLSLNFMVINGRNIEVGCDDCEMTSLATIRTQNIARNERFLAALFGHERTGSSNSSLPADIIDPNDTKVISVAEDDEYCEPTSSIDLAVDEKERLHKIDSLEHIKNFTFHFRKDEINRVLGYLDRSLAPAPSLLITGAAGTGKSVCTQHALSTFDVPGSYTTFLGLSDSKQVIRQICYDVRACINKMVTSRSNRTNKAGSSKVGSQSTQPWNQENKIPNSFSDLSKYFFAILESKTYQWPVLNVILDRLDLIDHLEAGLSIKMLKLGELSHPKLKVIAISRIPNFQIFSGLHLIFRPYSDHQIEAIIKNKAAEVCCSNYVGEPSGKSAHTSAIMSHFSKVIRHSLPRLLLRTRHVGVLWEECLSIWRGLMAQDFHEFCIDYKGDVFDITLPAYKAANLGIIKMPIANVKGNKLASIIPAGKAFIKSSTGKRELLIDEPLCMGPILMTVNTKLNLDTFQGAKWCDHLTHNTKYLTLAAFLASNNPKETDDHTFGVNNKRGKRKKKKMGTESDEGSNSTNRSFSIERLMSIFSQIVCINGNKNMGILSDMKGKSNKSSSNTKAFYLEVQNTYGDSDLFSAVSTLVLQKYLLLGPGWTLEHPTYYSTVSQEMAEEVANALHPRFHLHDFMYSAKEC